MGRFVYMSCTVNRPFSLSFFFSQRDVVLNRVMVINNGSLEINHVLLRVTWTRVKCFSHGKRQTNVPHSFPSKALRSNSIAGAVKATVCDLVWFAPHARSRLYITKSQKCILSQLLTIQMVNLWNPLTEDRFNFHICHIQITVEHQNQ